MANNVPANLKYTKEHEWALISGNEAKIGITDFAQHELGDIVFIDLPAVGKIVKQGDSLGEIEAVKTVAPLYSPLSGKVVEVNTALSNAAEGVNKDPYGEGWIVKLSLDKQEEVDALMDAKTYEGLL